MSNKVYREKDRQCTYNVTLRRVLTTIVAVEKNSSTYSECDFVASGVQHALHKRHIIIFM